MKKKLAQALTLGATGVLTASSVLSPVTSVMADEISQENVGKSVEEGTNEETKDSSGSGDATINPDKSDGEVQPDKGEVTPDKGEVVPPAPEPEEPENPTTIKDIGVLASLEGNSIVKSNILYSNELKLNIGAASLKEGIVIDSVTILEDKTGKTVAELDGGSAIVELVDFEGTLSVTYAMSDGTVLTQPLADIIPEIKGIVKYEKDTTAPVEVSTTFKGDIQEINGINYYVTDGDLLVEVEDLQSGVKGDSWSVVEAKGMKISDDGTTVTLNTKDLPEGKSSYTISVADNLGNTATINVPVNMYRVTPSISGGESKGIFVKDKISYIKNEATFTLSGYENEYISKIELLKDGNVLYTVSNGSFSISESGTYSIRLYDIKGNTVDYQLDDLYSDINSSFDVDTEAPETGSINFSGTMTTGDDGMIYLLSNGNLVLTFKDDLSGINDSSCTVTGANTFSISNGTVSIPVNDLPEGRSDITISVKDNLGNSTSSTTSIYLFREKPVIKGDSHTDVIEGEGITYIRNEVTGTLSGTDSEKIAKTELLKDGVVLSEIVDGKFSISESGIYTIRTTDLVNEKVEYKLQDLFSDINSNILIDNTAPSFLQQDFDGDAVQNNGNTYYVKNGNILISAEDKESGIEGSTWVAKESRGIELDTKVSKDGTSLSIDTTNLPEGVSTISLEVTDKSGLTSTKDITVYMHRVFPAITGKSHSDVKLIGDKVYIKEPMSVTLEGTDSEKISKVELIKDGEVLSEIKNGKFSIAESGNYLVRVTDIVNKTVDYNLKDLFSDITSDVVLDVTAPTLRFSDFTGDKVIVDNVIYYVKDGNIELTFEDKESGIASWSVKGVSEDDYTVSSNGNTVSISTVNLPEGLCDMSVSVEDNLGNITDYNFSAYMHRYAPEIKGKSHSSTVLKDGVVYENKSLSISLEGTDNYKIKRIELLKDNTVVDEITDGKFVINKSGTYQVRVIDLVNNATIYNLEGLFDDLSSIVVMDTSAPTVDVKLNNEDLNLDSWVTDSGKLSVKISDDIALKSAKISINGKVFIGDYNGTLQESIDVDLLSDVPRADNGLYRVTVEAVDISGNAYTLESKTIKADFDKPVLSDVSVDGFYVQDSETGKTYLKGSLKVFGRASDIGSGVAKVELLRGGEVVSEGLPFVIKESGSYSIRVTDKAGLSIEKTLQELTKINSNDIVADNELPTVERVSGFTEDLELGSKLWFAHAPKLEYKISDTNLKNVNITVNGDKKVSKISDTGSYVIDTTGYEGEVVVRVYSEDRVGNKTEDTFTYYSDFTKPTDVSAMISKDSTFKDGRVFFKETPSILVNASDKGIGLQGYFLTGSKTEENATGQFTLGDGEYFVEIKDKLGNTTGVLSVASLIGLNSNTFVVDGDAPVISTKRPSGDYNGWFSKDVTYDIDLSDNIGLDSAVITINGIEVDKFATSDGAVKDALLHADTSKVQPTEQGMYDVKVSVVDNAGNSSTWSDQIYIDREAPTVNEFIFSGKGYQEGVNVGGTDRYGFFFDGSASCEIHVSDGKISSGIKNLYVTLENMSGGATQQVVDISGGVARVDIPNNFKGFISAYATDNVENQGKVAKPDGLVTEDSNAHINNITLNINMPNTNYSDISGNPLYPSDITASADIGCGISGLRNIEWGIGEDTLGTVNVDSNGNPTGDYGSIKITDKNLVLNLTKSLSLQGNANGLNLWLRVTDRTGHVSESSRVFSIDKDAPVISVAYDSSEADNYYNKTRVATITVKERNFDPAQFSVDGVSGSMGSWSNSGDTWTNTVTFADDNEYHFTLNCTDRAGNKAEQYSSESFFIDKTAPRMSVSWNTDSPSNGNFYNQTRVATVTVVEKNFDGSLFTLEGNGVLGGWSSSGDTHTASITFDKDGEYEFSISGKDKADNTSEAYKSDKFIIDKTVPTLEISGVDNSISYKEDVGFTIKMSDTYLDSSKTTVTLQGRKNGTIRVNGTVNEKTGEFSFSSMPKEESYDDIYTLKATVTDKAGNTVDKDVVFSVNRFGSKYTFLDASILGTYLNKAKDVVITEENVDKLDTNKARVSVIRDGNEVKVDPKYVNVEESGGSSDKYNYSYTVDSKAFDKDGKYLVQVYSHAVEGTDYNSVSEEYAFVLDTQNPEIIVSGVKDDKRYKDYSKKVAIDVRDMSGVKDIKVTLNGKDIALNKKNGVYSFEIKESEDRQGFKVDVTDLAGNKSTKEVSNFLITSNAGVFLVNQTWFKLGIGAILAFLAAIIALIAKSRHDSKKEEESLIKEHEELIKTSTTGSSSASSSSQTSGSVEKDIVEDFEHPEEDTTTDLPESDTKNE